MVVTVSKVMWMKSSEQQGSVFDSPYK